ncbi:MAG: deoxyribose-phosphate aldolase [Verrucomicrobiota bacterium]|jgi:deoxyribose-phosphate aldolase|nr:deoxyribose-phosphate aldolase [Verrucomicrobiota bacterium]MDP7049228.1 deoxyribose-phosphate aldolase [Verrucomicrobiota bacterium]
MADQPEVTLNKYIDHTLLRPDTTAGDIEKLCAEAIEHQMFAVCINGCWVQHAWNYLADSDVSIATVVGFPLGASDSDSKRYETEIAVDNGAHEIDMVMNLGQFIDGDHQYIVREIRDVIEAADDRRVKVIVETGHFSDKQIAKACQLAVEAEAHFVKTSTGFGPGGATVEHVRLMRETVGQQAGVKASAGIRDRETALAMIEAGATRIGTSSGVTIARG